MEAVMNGGAPAPVENVNVTPTAPPDGSPPVEAVMIGVSAAVYHLIDVGVDVAAGVQATKTVSKAINMRFRKLNLVEEKSVFIGNDYTL